MADATRVLVFPAFSGNPYLAMMEHAPRERGFDVVSVLVLDRLYDEGKQLARGDVLHVHWTSTIAQRATDEKTAWAKVTRFKRFVDTLRANGVWLIWTVHNRLPHEVAHVEPELDLCRFLADRADLIHVMSIRTAEIVDDLYQLPAHKIRMIPHPSYWGVYDHPPSGVVARERFGLEPDEPTVLSFGRMRAYKGIDTLFGAVRRLTQRGDRPPTLLLAGAAKKAERAAIEAGLPESPVITHFGFVDDADVPDWFGAADVAVFPFQSVLNSGSVHLAPTLGVPVILPGVEHLREQFSAEPWVRFYDVDDAVASLAELIADPDRTDHSAAMEAFTQRHAPQIISEQYADMLTELTSPRISRPSG